MNRFTFQKNYTPEFDIDKDNQVEVPKDVFQDNSAVNILSKHLHLGKLSEHTFCDIDNEVS